MWGLATNFIERKLTVNSLFNIDEIVFSLNLNSSKVVAVLGSINMWLKMVEVYFHMTMTAECSVDNIFSAPLFIFRYQWFNRADIDQLFVPNKTIISVIKRFMNYSMFKKWPLCFEQNISGCVKRPLVLL